MAKLTEPGVYQRMVESRQSCAQNIMASSVPLSIPVRATSKWSGYDVSDGPTAFVPPHKLSCRDADHLSGSVPLSSSSQLRTRTKILQSTGMLPSNSTVGFLVSRTGPQAEEKETVDEAASLADEKSPRSDL